MGMGWKLCSLPNVKDSTCLLRLAEAKLAIPERLLFSQDGMGGKETGAMGKNLSMLPMHSYMRSVSFSKQNCIPARLLFSQDGIGGKEKGSVRGDCIFPICITSSN
jgi:hypothetical protein